jgi:hypothetical protein
MANINCIAPSCDGGGKHGSMIECNSFSQVLELWAMALAELVGGVFLDAVERLSVQRQ